MRRRNGRNLKWFPAIRDCVGEDTSRDYPPAHDNDRSRGHGWLEVACEQRQGSEHAAALPGLPLVTPGDKLFPGLEVELLADVPHVELDRADLDPEPDRDLHVRATRPQLLEHAPLGRRQHVWVWWSTSPGHCPNLAAGVEQRSAGRA